MKRLFLNKTLSKQLKKKGFDEPCIAITNGKTLFYGKFHNQHAYYDCGLILYQQAIDWFRVKHLIEVSASSYYYPIHYGIVSQIGYSHESNTKYPKEQYAENREDGLGRQKAEKVIVFSERTFKSYYEALNKAIIEALKLIK